MDSSWDYAPLKSVEFWKNHLISVNNTLAFKFCFIFTSGSGSW